MRVEKYGSYFLDEIRKYCEEKKLSSRMNEIKFSDKKEEAEKKPKQVKGASQKESLELYKSGKTIEEIIELRNLKESTIASHLSQFVKTGEIDIDDFVSKDKRAEAMELVKKNPDQSNYKTLYNFLNATEMAFFIAWQRLQKTENVEQED